MSKKSPTVIAVNRLGAELARHGVALKRTQLLQAVAAAFGHRTAHEFSAAAANDGISPPQAHLIGRTTVEGVGVMLMLQDDAGNVFAVDEHRFDMQEGQAADWLVSPFGGLVDVSALRATAPAKRQRPALAADGLTTPPMPEGSPAVGIRARACLAIRSGLNRAIYGVVHGHRMGNMTEDDGLTNYPLLDLMSNPGPDTIETGEMEMVDLVDRIEEAVRGEMKPRSEASAGGGLHYAQDVLDRHFSLVADDPEQEPHAEEALKAVRQAIIAQEGDGSCDGSEHCCCCGAGEACCDCGKVMPPVPPRNVELARTIAQGIDEACSLLFVSTAVDDTERERYAAARDDAQQIVELLTPGSDPAGEAEHGEQPDEVQE